MKADPTSLENLHDLIPPSSVPFWPPAPGWYIVSALLILALLWICRHSWKRWNANGYRREALHLLQSCEHTDEIAEVLRRTALAFAPRRLIAAKSGPDWPDWLAAQCSEPMPDTVRNQLSLGIYTPSAADTDLELLRLYATRWLTSHHVPVYEAESTTTANPCPKENIS
ncbi:DUF4381 domain-containing protein [Desulfosediminicola flagellatus]|uniref:DUF4381 domain-containing protein n=1 Tax=Desulfosediminicola flagellatus TaxID=2569541 RepID=UPI0010AC3863|nr:DUF4381 domain-containing protein [Desulfosediminicola flagellatus]